MRSRVVINAINSIAKQSILRKVDCEVLYWMVSKYIGNNLHLNERAMTHLSLSSCIYMCWYLHSLCQALKIVWRGRIKTSKAKIRRARLGKGGGGGGSQWFITHSCFDHIRNDNCPNDSRRIMPFVASVPFWFLAGKYALENSSIVCRVPF